MSFVLFTLLANPWLFPWSELACGPTPVSSPLLQLCAVHQLVQRSTTAPAKTPGGYIQVSQRMLHLFLHRQVKQNQSVSERILKMTTQGMARAECNIGVDLVPNSRAAAIRLTMNGKAIMDNAVSTMRNIEVHSSSYTTIRGHKDIFFFPEGLSLQPSQAVCNTSIRVHDIEARRPFVERIAWRKVGKMQPQAEQIASARAADRAEQQLESEAGKPLAELHKQYRQNVYEPLVRRGSFPDARLATTDDHLLVRFFPTATKTPTRSSADQHHRKPPQLARDVAVCLSDDFVNEIAAINLAGKTITDVQWATLMETFLGKTPRQLWVHERTDRWSVITAKERPVVVTFEDDLLSITLRFEKVIRGDQQLERSVQVSAQFELEPTADGPHLMRSGDVVVEFYNDSDVSSGPEVDEFCDFLRRKFNGVFLSDLYFDGLIPPAGGSWGKLRQLSLTQLSSREGWFAIGYSLPAKERSSRAPGGLPSN